MPAWLHGWSGQGMVYATVWVPLMAGLARGRAGLRQWLYSPLLAAPLTVAAGAGAAVLAPGLEAFGLNPVGTLQLALSAGASAMLNYAIGVRWARRVNLSSALHQRGALVMDDASHGRTLRRARGHPLGRDSARSLSLAGAAVPLQNEAKHFKFIGTTGTGKSMAIKELMDGALRRGDRAIFADPDGGYLRRYFNADRGDVVLNPFDAAAMKWDLFGELTSSYDVEQLARSLIPDGNGSDRSWNNYARTFFVAVTRQAHEGGVRDMGELYRLLVAADAAELRVLLNGTAAQPFLEENNSRMFDSIRSVASSAVSALEYVAQQHTEPLSIRQWVARPATDQRGGVLFMPYKAGQIAALRSTISAWMRLAIFAAMDQEEGDQRLWFVVDELDALGQIDGLKDALARLRKFGGRCVLGFQSIGQVSNTYGSGEAQTIVENCSNTLILRCSSSQHGGTASFASRLIGQREVLRSSHSHSKRPTDWFASTTRSENLVIEPAVLDSELEQLADRQGYLKLSSMPQWQRVTLPIVPAAPIVPAEPAVRALPTQSPPTPIASTPTALASTPSALASTPGALASAAARQAWKELRSAPRHAAVTRHAAAESKPKRSPSRRRPAAAVTHGR